MLWKREFNPLENGAVITAKHRLKWPNSDLGITQSQYSQTECNAECTRAHLAKTFFKLPKKTNSMQGTF